MPPLDASRLRVFVAEDDPAILELLTVRLDLAGYLVGVARDGAEAVERVTGFRPGLAILDVNMPRLDGFGVLRFMRARPALASVPVLMLTARNAPSDIASARAEGADDYVCKPFDDKTLLMRVARLAGRRRHRAPPTPPRPVAVPETVEEDDVFLI